MTGPAVGAGALVVSLDFELHWGLRDHVARGDPAFSRLVEARQAVVDLATLFAERDIHATWATVGLLFASTRDDLDDVMPDIRPRYRSSRLDPYAEPIGQDEATDPEHLAGSLVELVASTPGQEVASHTFSHFYCLEEGQDEAAFRADLTAAQAIAANRGVHLTSLVLPRNQWNPAYAQAVLDCGFRCIRGPQPAWAHRSLPSGGQTAARRVGRLVDSYVGPTPPPTIRWDTIRRPDGLCDVPASAFLRPYDPRRRALEPLRAHRLRSGLRDAARRQRIFHLWWHPHNFATHRTENLDFLRVLLDEFDHLRSSGAMRSLSMAEVAEHVRPDEPRPTIGGSRIPDRPKMSVTDDDLGRA